MTGRVASGPSTQQQQGQTVAGGFVVAPAGADQPKVVRALVPLEPYLINFLDGQGKEHTQVAFFNRQAGTVVLIHEKIDNTAIASDTPKWLSDSFKKLLNKITGQSEPTAA